jgi:TadE-like protein
MRRPAGRERGSASAELLWTLPFLMVCLLVALQLFFAASTAVSANNAARAGARASSLGGDGQAAARQALVPWLRGSARIAAGGGAASVTVQMPLLLPKGVPYVFRDQVPTTVSRSAQLPVSEGFGF